MRYDLIALVKRMCERTANWRGCQDIDRVD